MMCADSDVSCVRRQDKDATIKAKLPQLFDKLLLLWKDAPVSNKWALEKLMEMFCKVIAPDWEMVKAVNFPSFLGGFFSEGKLIQYPDFVMNNVAIMAARVLLMKSDGITLAEQPALRIIMSPLYYKMLTSGHRADITFKLYRNFLGQEKLIRWLDGVDFVVPQALVYCLGSPHNYTRKSAGRYFLDLVNLGFNKKNARFNPELYPIAQKIKELIMQQIVQLNAEFSDVINKPVIRNSRDGHQLMKWFMLSLGNYCQQLGCCAEISEAWCGACAQTDLFEYVIKFLQTLIEDGNVELPELYRSCTAMLVKLTNKSTTRKVERSRELIELLLLVVRTNKYSNLCDAVYMARLLNACDNIEGTDNRLVTELSLLPLFVLLGAGPLTVTSSTIAISMKAFLSIEQKSRPSILIKEAVDNFDVLTENKLSSASSDVLDYWLLKTLEPPPWLAQPMLCGESLRNHQILTFLTMHIPKVVKRLEKEKECYIGSFQMYIKACLNFPSASHMHLSVVLESYVALMKHSHKIIADRIQHSSSEGMDSQSKEGFQDIVQILQRKMVDFDPNIRELGVKTIGDLWMIGDSILNSAAVMADGMFSLWQCISDRSEGVALKVLELLLMGTESGKLTDLLEICKISEKDLRNKIHHFLLSSTYVWDSIKPVAFDLLTKLSSDDQLVRYAEACLLQDNSRLSLKVVAYIQQLFTSALTEKTDHEKIENVLSLLKYGWGDLLLLKSSTTDISSLRTTSSLVKQISLLMDSTLTLEILDSRVSLLFSNEGISMSQHLDKAHEIFSQKCQDIMQTFGFPPVSTETRLKNATCDNGDSKPVIGIAKRKSIATDNSNGEAPLQKKPKLQEEKMTDCSGLCSICLLCSLLDEEIVLEEQNIPLKQEEESLGAPWKRVLVGNGEENDENYLDSTKELPSLSLSSNPFPSQSLTQAICTKKLRSHSLQHLIDYLPWFIFTEIFRTIEPVKLEEEAQRSTDEYERDTLMILDDLDRLLDRSFENIREQLHDQFTDQFVICFSDCLSDSENITSPIARGQLLKDLVTLIIRLRLISEQEENVMKFILKERKSVFNQPARDNERNSILFTFVTHLSKLKQGRESANSEMTEYCTSRESLGILLDMFWDKFYSRTSSNTSGHYVTEMGTRDSFLSLSSATECIEKTENVSADESLDEHAQGSLIERLASVLQNHVHTEQDVIADVLKLLKPKQILGLLEVISGEIETERILVEELKVLLQSARKGHFLHIVNYLLKLCKYLVLNLFDDDEETKADRYWFIVSNFRQLEEWVTSESDDDDSDGDNDPTALDCF